MNNIGILTSGGDAPGMNAAVWSAVKCAHARGINILGIRYGYQGLLDKDISPLTAGFVDNILNNGGTALGTARCPAMLTEEGRAKAGSVIKEFGIEGLIVVGGDGSFQGAKVLSERGIPTVGLPGTIDNDLNYTDYTIGFDTACNTAMDAVMKIRDTMKSHNRVAIVEVMGRHCGDIALTVGLAVGADYILVPEVPYAVEFDMDRLLERMIDLYKQGKRFGIIISSEGVRYDMPNRASVLADRLDSELQQKGYKFDIREMVLAHMQRGGCPTVFDRRLAIETAAHAVNLLANGIGNRVVGIRQNRIFDMDIVEALDLNLESNFNKALYDMALSLSKTYNG